LTMHKTDMKTIKVNRNEIKSVWKGTGVVWCKIYRHFSESTEKNRECKSGVSVEIRTVHLSVISRGLAGSTNALGVENILYVRSKHWSRIQDRTDKSLGSFQLTLVSLTGNVQAELHND
jgi:hypothetical protein